MSKRDADQSAPLGMVVNADGTVSEPTTTTIAWQQLAGGVGSDFNPTAVNIKPILIGPAASPAQIVIIAALEFLTSVSGSHTYRVQLYNPNGILVASGSRTNGGMVAAFEEKEMVVQVAELNVDKSKLIPGNYQLRIERTGGTGSASASGSNAQATIFIVG